MMPERTASQSQRIGAPEARAGDAAAGGLLAPYKRPKQVVVVAEIPRNPMGKVQLALFTSFILGMVCGYKSQS